jgi:hypothetical protein
MLGRFFFFVKGGWDGKMEFMRLSTVRKCTLRLFQLFSLFLEKNILLNTVALMCVNPLAVALTCVNPFMLD